MPKLTRTLTWKMLSLYGLGNILGAGIYVLIGEVAAESGDAIIWSFLIAAVVASLTAITYSTMAGRYPKSAGAAVYTEKAFANPLISTIVGLAIGLTTIVSSSALLRGFDRYFQELLIELGVLSDTIPSFLFTLPLLGIMAVIAYRGIKDSARLAILFTLLEAFGLLLIIIVAGMNGDVVNTFSVSMNALTDVSPIAIGLGGFLAFYAFIGFEDMVNVAEEVKSPQKNMKKGMLTALCVASVMYIMVGIGSLSVLSSSELATSNAPLASVFQAATGSSLPIITIIGVIAITNGVLIQIITGSRILYGLGREKWIPKIFSTVSPKTHTPTVATATVLGFIAITSTLLPLGALAQITSFILLVVFTMVHISALKLIATNDLDNLKRIVPILGIITNLVVIILQISSWLGYL